jgi:hypothetical protein
MSARITHKTPDIINYVRSLYVVPDGNQIRLLDSGPQARIESIFVREVLMAADISRLHYELYSFATKHQFSEPG